MDNYESALKRAYAEGWREPNKIADLEMAAYTAGMKMERRRVLSILEPAMKQPLMRIMDFQRLINKISNPNDK
jgi:hypothetical protein